MLLGHLSIFSCETPSSFAHFFLLCHSFSYWSVGILYTGYKSFVGYMYCEYLLPLYGYLSLSLMVSFDEQFLILTYFN